MIARAAAQLRAELAVGGAGEELGHLLAVQPGHPQPHQALRPPQVDEASDSSAGTSASVSRKVARIEHPRVRGGAREMPEQQQGRRVGPVPVLDHEQHGTAAAGADEQVGDGHVQAQALGVLVAGERIRQVSQMRAQLREQAGQLARARAQIRAQLAGVGVSHEPPSASANGW